MSRLKRGSTLIELVLSLGVSGVIVALAVKLSTGQLRFMRAVTESAAVQGQLAGANTIVASVLWDLAPPGGDIVTAQDSALEVRMTIGSAVVCESTPGRVTIPAPSSPNGNTLGAYTESPEADDVVVAFLEDSAGGTWLTFHVSNAPTAGGACTRFPDVQAVWTLSLREPVILPAGTAVRFCRPMRFSLYRASNSQWYLGARDWNGSGQRFNAIQPVAGPLRAYQSGGSGSGFLLTYQDRAGSPFSDGSDTRGIAAVRIVSRGSAAVVAPAATTPSTWTPDSLVTRVSFRNSR